MSLSFKRDLRLVSPCAYCDVIWNVKAPLRLQTLNFRASVAKKAAEIKFLNDLNNFNNFSCILWITLLRKYVLISVDWDDPE